MRLVTKGKISTLWKVINEIIPSQKNKYNAYTYDNLKYSVEEFNNFFSGVG